MKDCPSVKITKARWHPDTDRFPDNPDTEVWIFRAYVDNKVVGYAEFYKDWNTVENVWVEGEVRRKGIATRLYDAIEKIFGTKLEPSDSIERDGLEFWKNRDRFHHKLRYR